MSHPIKLAALLVGVGLFEAACTTSHALIGEQTPVVVEAVPGEPIDASNSTDCPKGDISEVIQIHLTKQRILAALAGTLDCTDTGPTSCVTANHADPGGFDDDDHAPGTFIQWKSPDRGREWATPFDIDLAPRWAFFDKTDKNGNKTDDYDWGLHKPILIKVVLDDDNDATGLRFYRPNDPSDPNNADSLAPAATNSSWALRAGGDNRDMFNCISPIVPREAFLPGGGGPRHSYVTVRVHWVEYGTNHAGRQALGGLNIGLLFKQSDGTFMPIYIDPVMHGSGR